MKDKIVIAGYGAVGQAHEYLLERLILKYKLLILTIIKKHGET